MPPSPRPIQCCWPDYFDAAIWFVFLLRSDVTAGGDLDSEETRRRFLMWWLCFGRREYVSSPVSPAQRAVAWEDVGFVHPTGTFRIPRILAYLLEQRRDVIDGATVMADGGVHRGFAWLLLSGLEEMGLTDLVDEALIASLNTPRDSRDSTVAPMTNLVALVWALRLNGRPDLGLPDPAERERIAAWVYTFGLTGESIGGFLSAATVTALREAIALPNGLRLTRHAYLCWRIGFPGVPAGQPVTAAAVSNLEEWHRGIWETLFAPRLARPAPPLLRDPRALLPPPTARGCTLIGYAFGELGIGEDVRMMSRALTESGVDYGVFDFSAETTARKDDRSIADRVDYSVNHAATVFCMTGFDTAKFYAKHGVGVFADRYVIGYWPWELPEWPAAWRAAIDLVDEIWVSSRYTQEAFCLTAPVPVIHMPMAVELPPAAAATRARFGLPEGRFLFLYVFDANSFLDRKNPQAAVAAFRAAFARGDEAVGLVFKVMNGASEKPGWRAFLDVCAGDPRIHILSDTMDKAMVAALMGVCDAYLSLHRSEGFGRTIAEAMLLGKPVVATAWSGSDELVRPDTAIPIPARLISVESGQYPWGAGQCWADPDIGCAAQALRRLVEDSTLAARLAVAGRNFVRRRHAAGVVGRRYRTRLNALGVL